MERYLPASAATVNGILVGSNIVATRLVIDQTDPASLALLRYFIGFCCLLPLLLLSARPRFEFRDLLPISLLGITQFGIVVTLLNFALQFIPSARAALISATLGRERVTVTKSLGVGLTIIGVGLALGDKVVQGGSVANVWIGELAVLVSALGGAICSVLYRPYLNKYPTLPLSAFAMLASVIFLAVFAAGEGFFNSWPQLTTGGWQAVGLIGISSAVGYYLWLWALNHTTPTKVTVFPALSPATATVLGALFLAESVSTTFLFGLSCVALGLGLAHWRANQIPDDS
jgi:drug/metabolite transporter (DMT)-like permease